MAPLSRPEIDAAVRRLTRGMILPEAMRMARGTYRRSRLAVPTLAVFGRCDHPWTEQNLSRACRKPERFADLALNWFVRVAGLNLEHHCIEYITVLD